ncbi:class II aldolase/adducin family protein [Ruminococcus sp. NK3A76]|uniref:class II aldolase/adducin family protein n=1 Tax=Ruminococcus sp. NK3A76 TaxID=877411 RepID=UPI00048C016C|nr:class II aldolase/adducin family protein [Ruminococcus sp. NK3A76]
MYSELREQIAEICRMMWQKGWAAANDGNISVNVGEGKFLATQTGICKAFFKAENVGLIDGDMNVLDAAPGFKPSSEIKMHLRCYRERADIGAVIHAHPVAATSFACAGLPLDDECMISTVLEVGKAPLVPYATPSTDEVPEMIAPYLQSHDVLLLENHGALALGRDLITAFCRMDTLEHQAQVSINARLLGGVKNISDVNVKKLISMRASYGLSSPPGA